MWAIISFADVTAVVLWIKHKNNLLLPFGIMSSAMFAVQIFATKISNWGFGIIAPAAIILYVDMLIITDIVNEKYGRKTALNMALLSFIPAIIMLVFGIITTLFTQPSFAYLSSYNSIFSLGVRIGIASFIAFFVDYLFDTYVYDKIKHTFEGKHLWARYLGAELPVLAIDSIIFITIAFYGVMPVMSLYSLMKNQMIIKYLLGIPALGLMYYGRWLLYRKTTTKNGRNVSSPKFSIL